jgi:hypothetical protein
MLVLALVLKLVLFVLMWCSQSMCIQTPTRALTHPTHCPPSTPRLQQYARDARKEYAELGSKDLSELKSFVKGLPKVLLLDRLSDLAVPVAEVVKQQVGAGLAAANGGWGWQQQMGADCSSSWWLSST